MESLKCSRCGKIKENYSEITYSRGDRICLDCQKICQKSDDAAYDRYVISGRES